MDQLSGSSTEIKENAINVSNPSISMSGSDSTIDCQKVFESIPI